MASSSALTASAPALPSIRIDRGTNKGSVYDTIKVVTGASSSHCVQQFIRLCEQKPDYVQRTIKIHINGVGRLTPVADAATLIELVWDLPGKRAREFCRASADKVRRMMGGDVSLVDEIERRHVEIAGTEEEMFLLGGNSQSGSDLVEPTPMMRYQLELKRLEQRDIELAHRSVELELEVPMKRRKIVEEWKKALEDIDAFTVTDRVHYQAAIRKTVADTDHPLRIEDGHHSQLKEYTLSEYLQLEKSKVLNFKSLMQPGKALADMYREVAKKEPGTKLIEVNGRATNVKAYTDQQIQGAPTGVTGFALMDKVARQFNLY